ncbi:MAG TPA: hypothetical protein VNW04_12380 [Puia sp.]|nr:hypothetical protein [Puia sp.]
MIPLEKIFTRVFFRSLFSVFGYRSPYYLKLWEFTPYFQYRIGPYAAGHVLCFRRKPYLELYKNEIFNKMTEYSGYDVVRYLQFHYDAFADGSEFLHFVWYEVTERLKGAYSKKSKYYHCLEIARDWTEQEMRKAAAKEGGEEEDAVAEVEPRLSELIQSFAGKISVNGALQLERVIQLFLLLQKVKSPGGAPLFESFTDTDLAAVLRQFDVFRDKKLNTVQKRIGDHKWQLTRNRNAEPMEDALQAYFYPEEDRP